MAATITIVQKGAPAALDGGRRSVIADINLGTYATGGVAPTSWAPLASAKIVGIETLATDIVSAYRMVFEHTNKLLAAYAGNAEVGNGVDLSAVTFRCRIITT